MQYNATCPFCGERDYGPTVHPVNHNVALGEEDFALHEGELGHTEIIAVECWNCNRDAAPHHYHYHAGTESCDCVEAFVAAGGEL